jgi:hypothetical protein
VGSRQCGPGNATSLFPRSSRTLSLRLGLRIRRAASAWALPCGIQARGRRTVPARQRNERAHGASDLSLSHSLALTLSLSLRLSLRLSLSPSLSPSLPLCPPQPTHPPPPSLSLSLPLFLSARRGSGHEMHRSGREENRVDFTATRILRSRAWGTSREVSQARRLPRGPPSPAFLELIHSRPLNGQRARRR